MGIGKGKNRLKISDCGEAVDVDVTPMMNVLMILLPVLISMAVFTKVAMIQFSVPPNVGTHLNSDNGKPKLKMTVVIAKEFYAITYGEKILDSIVSNVNAETILSGRIASHKSSFDIQNEAVVAVKDNVDFQRMVRVMDICRENGFEKIGVSGAPENPDNGV
ncbi:MAG: biopolymer transporter ExbD [Fibrobacter sp.]|nr:biopolymer transporter ExbD [Fibrobacter sp.]